MTTRIFVTGSTGYIGLEVASTLRRAGHKVYGLVRSEDKAKALRQNEIIPVLGNIDQPDTYCEALAKCSVVIDTVLDFSNPFAGNLKLLEASGEGALQKKKLFIYTSGCLVHGSGKEIVDEDTIERTPLPPLLKRRVEFENAVLSSSKVDGVVIRPSFVYGGLGGGGFVAPKDKYTVKGDKDRRWSWVHVSDLADGYLHVVQAPRSVVRGEVFTLSGPTSPTYEEVVLATAKAAGYTGQIEYGGEPEPGDFINTVANMNVVVSSRKATDLLGWRPKHLGFLEELDIYVEAWKANNS